MFGKGFNAKDAKSSVVVAMLLTCFAAAPAQPQVVADSMGGRTVPSATRQPSSMHPVTMILGGIAGGVAGAGVGSLTGHAPGDAIVGAAIGAAVGSPIGVHLGNRIGGELLVTMAAGIAAGSAATWFARARQAEAVVMIPLSGAASLLLSVAAEALTTR